MAVPTTFTIPPLAWVQPLKGVETYETRDVTGERYSAYPTGDGGYALTRVNHDCKMQLEFRDLQSAMQHAQTIHEGKLKRFLEARARKSKRKPVTKG